MLAGNKGKIKSSSAGNKISSIGTSTDQITGRAGLNFLAHYIDTIGNRSIQVLFGQP